MFHGAQGQHSPQASGRDQKCGHGLGLQSAVLSLSGLSSCVTSPATDELLVLCTLLFHTRQPHCHLLGLHSRFPGLRF